MYSVSELNGYQGSDYADLDDRAFVRTAMETTARHFDEVLPDDCAEQLLDTVFARCPDTCCFNYGGMIGPVRPFSLQGRT